ncbi:uncharacterized protein BKA55DRAFT_599837 [Fusarium redolens]|uniref:Uncharacterized protein n=1 Tax=Fusarium redolens TaxID=48865 RepID=A0A9P9FY02_FUSRE|nr:uncharacterized protein BKA55DRAFT_599837 [Fusarium redolens]KAH7213379.1 hypothetical protein BKA55DRAFT_599837 [Fusarium redolens]
MDKKRNLGRLDCNWDTCSPRNRSVYLWHAGLWTACRESYTVVSKYWKEYGWPDVPAQMQDRNRGGRNWFMFEELFVNWKPISVLAENPQGQRKLQKFRKLAVKFDPSWNDELAIATRNTRISQFSPALAFMIRVLLDVAYQRVDGPKLMVIDDVSQWATLRRRGNPLRAADCGHGSPRLFVHTQATKNLQYG